MNKVIMIGRLTKEPDVSYGKTESGIAIAKISLAVRRKTRDKDGKYPADFFDITAFGKLAEFAEKWLHKGSQICVEGRLENHNYVNKEGKKVYSDQIIADGLEFAEGRTTTGDGYSSPERISDAELPMFD